MKNFTSTVLLYFLAISGLIAQNWKSTGALAGTGSNSYLTGATHVGDTIFVLSMEQNIAYSTDLGVTWTKQSVTKPNGIFAGIIGIKDRLYASLKINTYDFDLYYSMDNGATWAIDTIGLPNNITGTGKSAMVLKYMGNNYVLAYNYTSAVYKKLGDPGWKPTSIDIVVADVAATSDKWLAIGQGKMLQSSDHGENWTTMNTKGLPSNFQGDLICTNGSRIFVSNPPADGAEDIYFSDDDGSNWTLTNSSGKFTFSNPWIKSMYAVDDYLFASIKPANFQDAPPFIVSSTTQPDFSVGDVSGLPTGRTITNLPFFFHVRSKLFTMFWDLYSSEPGFTGTIPTNSKVIQDEVTSISIYPNPANKCIHLKGLQGQNVNIKFFDLSGKISLQRSNLNSSNSIDISKLKKGFYLIQAVPEQGHVFQTKFIKN